MRTLPLLCLLACQDKAPADEAPRRCNGAEALCDQPFDAVIFPGTHNSMSNEEDGWLFPNQGLSIPHQLELGVRGFLIDTYEVEGVATLCHSDCDWGSASLVEVLTQMNDFLDAHPDEAVVFIVQDALSVEATVAAFEAAGMAERVISHTLGEPWPTLGALLDEDRRVLVSAESEGPPPDWYFHAWDLFSDTGYGFDSVEAFDCALNRGSLDNDLFLMNHWVRDVPTRPAAAEANAAEVLRARAEQCAAERDHVPNLIAVDFADEGDLIAVVAALNAG